jgi:hypothetical protein
MHIDLYNDTVLGDLCCICILFCSLNVVLKQVDVCILISIMIQYKAIYAVAVFCSTH